VKIEFDPEKDATNQEKHGLSLADTERMEFDTAIIVADTRHAYGEERFRAYGLIDGRLCALAYTIRGTTLRAISLRKANSREVNRYGKRA